MLISITIEGTSPLLMNRFTDAAAIAATSGIRGSGPRSDEPRDDAESRLYTNEEGVIIIPGPNLLRCITEGGKFHKAGKSKVTTLKSSLIPGSTIFNEIYVVLEHEQPWKVDTRPIRIPTTGGRILRHRPCFDDWRLTFSVELDTDTIPVKLFRMIVDDAGKKIGLGDFRPDCKGPYGRFVVVNWKIE